MPDASNLSNDGFMTLLPDGYEPPEERTFIVIGLARGGTTMVARLLDAFGVHMGDEADNPVVEDRRIAAAIEDGGATPGIRGRTTLPTTMLHSGR